MKTNEKAQDVVIPLESEQDVDDLISDLRLLKRQVKKTGGKYRVHRTDAKGNKAVFEGWW